MCTAVSLEGKYHLFGRTLDIDNEYGQEVISLSKDSKVEFKHLLSLNEHPAILGMGIRIGETSLFFDAVHENGLCAAALNFPHFAAVTISPFVIPEALKAAGAVGVMLNHAEHKLTMEELAEAIKRADEVGLATMVCADSVDEVKAIAKLAPNILVAEPTELIGTGKPADKEYVDEVIKCIREINPEIKPFPSAGISKGEDCYNIIKAGSSASGCSSAIAKAENPLALAEEMIAAVRKAWDETHS